MGPLVEPGRPWPLMVPCGGQSVSTLTPEEVESDSIRIVNTSLAGSSVGRDQLYTLLDRLFVVPELPPTDNEPVTRFDSTSTSPAFCVTEMAPTA